MRSEKEIYAEMDKTNDQQTTGRSAVPGMSYEEGVRDALDWVLLHTDDSPMDGVN